MSFRWLARSPVALLTGWLVLGHVAPAQAAISFDQTRVQLTPASHADAVSRLYISRSDCTTNAAFQFPLFLTDFAANTLQVWATDASVDCSDPTQRSADTALCWKVYELSSPPQIVTVPVRVQDIVKGRAGMLRDGTGADCSMPAVGTGTTLQQITFYFLLVNGNSLIGTATNWSTKIDLNGPVPPTGIALGRGGSLLKLTWNVTTDPDVAGYRVYCDSRTVVEGITPPNAAGGAGGTAITTDAGASCDGALPAPGDGGDDADDAADGAKNEAGATMCIATNSASGAATDAGSTTVDTSGCTSALPTGSLPTAKTDQRICAQVPGNQSGGATLSDLNNGQVYNVAVAAYDVVGNSGNLSSVVCGAPEPVFGFAEAYKDAGGTAGGGFCSVGRLGAGHVAGAGGGAVMVLAAALLARRRRRIGEQRPL